MSSRPHGEEGKGKPQGQELANHHGGFSFARRSCLLRPFAPSTFRASLSTSHSPCAAFDFALVKMCIASARLNSDGSPSGRLDNASSLRRQSERHRSSEGMLTLSTFGALLGLSCLLFPLPLAKVMAFAEPARPSSNSQPLW